MFDGILETADTLGSLAPYEIFKGKDSIAEYASKTKASKEVANAIFEKTITTPDWVKAASSIYKTSPDLSDYFIVPTIIMPSDLPNRNGTAFPRKELARFDPEMGRLKYQGWIGKPVYHDHKNSNYDTALGMVIDAYMKPMKSKGDLWKVISLMAIDRTKNPGISNSILAGNRRTYSMGAWVQKYKCSVCGCVGEVKKGMKNKYEAMPCGHSHAGLDRTGRMKTFPLKRNSELSTLGFLNAMDIKPFEISSVTYPAFSSAFTPEWEISEL